MRSTADLVPEYPAMAGNAIVAATDAILTMAPIITEAPAFASASAIAAPMPRAPPVTRALRPARLFSLIVCSSLYDFIVATRHCLPSGEPAAQGASLLLPAR